MSTASPTRYYGPAVCIPLTLEETVSNWQADGPWIAGGIILGLIVGIVIAALCCKFVCIKSYAKKKLQDEEYLIMQKKGIPHHARGQLLISDTGAGSHLTKTSTTTVTKKQHVKVEQTRTRQRVGLIGKKRKQQQFEEAVPGVVPVLPPSFKVFLATERGMADALLKPNNDSTTAELLDQEIGDIAVLENELKEQKIQSFVQSTKCLLALLVSKEKVSEDKARDIQNEMESSIRTSETPPDDSEGDEGTTVSKDGKTIKQSEDNESKLQISLLKNEEEMFRQQLNRLPSLNDEEVEAVMGQLMHDMANVESKLAQESTRQAMALEGRLAKRRLLADKVNSKKQIEANEIEAKVDVHKRTLDKMVIDSKMLERQKNNLLKSYEENLRKVQENHEEDLMSHKLKVHEKLRRRREAQLRKLVEKQEKEKESLVKESERKISTSEVGTNTGTEFIEKYHNLVQGHRYEQDQEIDRMDEEDAQSIEQLRQEGEERREKALERVDDQLVENLETKAQLNQAEVNRIMQNHNQEMAEFDRIKQEQKKAMNSKLAEKLEKRKHKIEENQMKLVAEQQAVKDQQESTIKKILESQADLTEQARDKIMMEHEKNSQALNNQLSLSKMKQQKALEKRLSDRKAKLTELKQKKEATKNQTKESIQKELGKQIEDEERKILEERKQAEAELRKKLAVETEEALKLQDSYLGELIGRLEVGQARRQAIIQKQDKTIKELQEKLGDKLVEKGGKADGTSEILKTHYNQMETLNEKLQSTKARQEQLLQEKLRKRKMKKAKEIEETLEEEAEEEFSDQKSRGAGLASELLGIAWMDKKHKKAMEELEHDFQMDFQKQREDLNKQLEEDMEHELEVQKKEFLAQLAAVSNLSKDEMNDVVMSAVTETGADDKTAKKLAKDLRLDVKKAKASLGMEFQNEGQDNAAYDYEVNEPRPKSSKRRGSAKKLVTNL